MAWNFATLGFQDIADADISIDASMHGCIVVCDQDIGTGISTLKIRKIQAT